MTTAGEQIAWLRSLPDEARVAQITEWCRYVCDMGWAKPADPIPREVWELIPLHERGVVAA